MTEYILQDRSTADKWALQIEQGQLNILSSVASAQAEPILQDDSSPGEHYKLFLEGGQLGLESVLTAQDDLIQLTDTSSGEEWKLIVADGQIGVLNIGSSSLISRLTVLSTIILSGLVLQDRGNSDKWNMQIEDGQIKISLTGSAAQEDPIFEDLTNAGTYFRLFISDGQVGVESTGTTQNDSIILEDTITGENWNLFVSEGQLGYTNLNTSNLPMSITVLAAAGSGSKVLPISITVLAAPVIPVAGYILQDRFTGDNWSLQIEDGKLNIVSTVAVKQSEPIFEDLSHSGTFYKLFILDGELGIESTLTNENDEILIEDAVTGDTWELFVDDGQFGYGNLNASNLFSRLTVLKKSFSSLKSSVDVSGIAPEYKTLNMSLTVLKKSSKGLISRSTVLRGSYNNLQCEVIVLPPSSELVCRVLVCSVLDNSFLIYSTMRSSISLSSLIKG